jgi:hypothetical protein
MKPIKPPNKLTAKLAKKIPSDEKNHFSLLFRPCNFRKLATAIKGKV